MKTLHVYRCQLLVQYGAIAQDLQSVLGKFPPQAVYHAPAAGEMTPHQVLAHVRDAEAQVFYPAISRILQEDRPVLKDDSLQEGVYSQEEPLGQILEEMTLLREQELEWLKSMPAEAWNRVGRHPRWGVRTLQWWVEASLAHAKKHHKQLNDLCEEVSPP